MDDVAYYLLALDRPTGALLRFEMFDDGSEALRARFAAEDALTESDDVEIVVLSSDSRATLEQTHARFFATLPALIQRTIDAAGAPAA